MPRKKNDPPESGPGLEPIGEPIGWRRWKIMCGRCGRDAGFVLASDLFRNKGKTGEPRQNEITEPRYITFGTGRSISAVCVDCLAEIASAYYSEHAKEQPS